MTDITKKDRILAIINGIGDARLTKADAQWLSIYIEELETALRCIAGQHTSDELRPLLDGHQDGDYEESHNTMISIARKALEEQE